MRQALKGQTLRSHKTTRLEIIDRRTEPFEVFAVKSGDCIYTGSLNIGGDVSIGEVPIGCASELQGAFHLLGISKGKALEGKDPGEDIKDL